MNGPIHSPAGISIDEEDSLSSRPWKVSIEKQDEGNLDGLLLLRLLLSAKILRPQGAILEELAHNSRLELRQQLRHDLEHGDYDVVGEVNLHLRQ